MKALFIGFFTIVICCLSSSAQTVVKIEDISKHIGDTVKICNKVYGGNYFNRIQGSPTYLYVGNSYPNPLLTIVIAKQDRANFEDRPEMMYAYKDVCITGKLAMEKGKPVLTVTKPEQIIIQKVKVD